MFENMQIKFLLAVFKFPEKSQFVRLLRNIEHPTYFPYLLHSVVTDIVVYLSYMSIKSGIISLNNILIEGKCKTTLLYFYESVNSMHATTSIFF